MADRGDFRAWAGHVRLDVFTPFSPFHDEVRKRIVAKPAASGRLINVLAAEDRVLFKVLFDRGKDWIDIENVVKHQGPSLDVAHLRVWSRELLPPGDGRVERLENVIRSVTDRSR